MSAEQSIHMKTTSTPPASPTATSNRDAMDVDMMRSQPHCQSQELEGVSLHGQEPDDNSNSTNNKGTVITTKTNVNAVVLPRTTSPMSLEKAHGERADEVQGPRPMVMQSTSQREVPREGRRHGRGTDEGLERSMRGMDIVHFQNQHMSQRNDGFVMTGLFTRGSDEKFHLREAARAADNRADIARAQLRQTQAEFQSSFQALENEKQDLMNELEASQATIRQLLDKLTHGKADGRWNPLSDQDIREKLNKLEKDIWGWAKTWASSKMPDAKVFNNTEFVIWSSGFCQFTPDGACTNAFKKAAVKPKGRLPSLMLSAALAREIQVAFFENPFFCIPEQAVHFESVFNGMLKSNPHEAHVWRSSLWRTLYPPNLNNPSSGENEIHELTYERIKGYCDRVDETFRKGHAAVFFAHLGDDAEKQARARSLRDILMYSANIAAGLWTQRCYLTTASLEYFNRSNQTAFTTSAPLMKAHSLNKVDVEEPIHNGRRIMLVTRPALLAFDTDDNKGFDGGDYRLLAKAVVYLEDLPGRG